MDDREILSCSRYQFQQQNIPKHSNTQNGGVRKLYAYNIHVFANNSIWIFKDVSINVEILTEFYICPMLCNQYCVWKAFLCVCCILLKFEYLYINIIFIQTLNIPLCVLILLLWGQDSNILMMNFSYLFSINYFLIMGLAIPNFIKQGSTKHLGCFTLWLSSIVLEWTVRLGLCSANR